MAACSGTISTKPVRPEGISVATGSHSVNEPGLSHSFDVGIYLLRVLLVSTSCYIHDVAMKVKAQAAVKLRSCSSVHAMSRSYVQLR